MLAQRLNMLDAVQWPVKSLVFCESNDLKLHFGTTSAFSLAILSHEEKLTIDENQPRASLDKFAI